jgi:hypothetical protein
MEDTKTQMFHVHYYHQLKLSIWSHWYGPYKEKQKLNPSNGHEIFDSIEEKMTIIKNLKRVTIITVL